MKDKPLDITKSAEYRTQKVREAKVEQDTKTPRPLLNQTFIDGQDSEGNHTGDVICNIQCYLSEDKAVFLAYDFDVFVAGLTNDELDDAIADYKALIHRVIAEKYKRRLIKTEDGES